MFAKTCVPAGMGSGMGRLAPAPCTLKVKPQAAAGKDPLKRKGCHKSQHRMAGAFSNAEEKQSAANMILIECSISCISQILGDGVKNCIAFLQKKVKKFLLQIK